MDEKLNDIIDKMFEIRENIRELDARRKDLEVLYRTEHTRLIARMKEVGTNYARGMKASASITEQLVPQIEDWGKVEAWIKENDAIYLLHRRVSSGPWKELLDTGVSVPGIEPFTKETISLKRLGD